MSRNSADMAHCASSESLGTGEHPAPVADGVVVEFRFNV